MDIFAQIALKIIKEQENIIGPVAVELAEKIPGLKVDWNRRQVSVEGNPTEAIEKLIEKYRNLFGHASVEVCRESVKQLIPDIPKDKVPKQLQ